MKNNLGDLNGSLKTCIKELIVKTSVGSVDLVYEVPRGCSGRIRLVSNMGSLNFKLKVPKGEKVVYDVKSNVGSAIVKGAPSPSGTFGEGNATIYLVGKSNMGSLDVIIEVNKLPSRERAR